MIDDLIRRFALRAETNDKIDTLYNDKTGVSNTIMDMKKNIA